MTDMRKDAGDPRLSLPAAEDVRPVVALPRTGMPLWVLIGIALLIGLLLFAALDARRRATMAPAPMYDAQDMTLSAPPPPLFIPPAPPAQPAMPSEAAPPIAPPDAGRAPVAAQPQPQTIYVPQPVPAQLPIEPPAPPRISAEPALVVDTSAPRGAANAGPAGAEGDTAAPPAAGGVSGPRARAGALANRSTTVPQGTLIPAVLETAIDSTRPGLARAIVSRDIRGFDGRQILIPRGSRLIGEYRSEAQPGQRRALVNWLRLVRPDGVTIAIGSPAADPVGRGGIRARVNNHFLQRFAGAILQSALDIGVNLAAAEAGNGAIVLLPGQLQGGASQAIPTQQVTPTLSVRQGTSISIFVARDLDFTGVSASR